MLKVIEEYRSEFFDEAKENFNQISKNSAQDKVREVVDIMMRIIDEGKEEPAERIEAAKAKRELAKKEAAEREAAEREGAEKELAEKLTKAFDDYKRLNPGEGVGFKGQEERRCWQRGEHSYLNAAADRDKYIKPHEDLKKAIEEVREYTNAEGKTFESVLNNPLNKNGALKEAGFSDDLVNAYNAVDEESKKLGISAIGGLHK